MAFSRAHFALVADILRSAIENEASLFTRTIVSDVAQQFADRFADLNPRFDPAHFLGACGLTIGDIARVTSRRSERTRS